MTVCGRQTNRSYGHSCNFAAHEEAFVNLRASTTRASSMVYRVQHQTQRSSYRAESNEVPQARPRVSAQYTKGYYLRRRGSTEVPSYSISVQYNYFLVCVLFQVSVTCSPRNLLAKAKNNYLYTITPPKSGSSPRPSVSSFSRTPRSLPPSFANKKSTPPPSSRHPTLRMSATEIRLSQLLFVWNLSLIRVQHFGGRNGPDSERLSFQYASTSTCHTRLHTRFRRKKRREIRLAFVWAFLSERGLPWFPCTTTIK